MTQDRPEAPELAARAPRPPVVRLRRGAAMALVLGASSLVAGALCWSFVVAPQLRAASRAAAAEKAGEPAPSTRARPAELIAAQPASYDRLATAELPEPRILGERQSAPAAQSAPRRAPPHRPRPPRGAAFEEALRSDLLVGGEPRRDGEQRAPAEPPAPAAAPSRRILQAGSVLPANLLTAIDTDRPGPVVAVVAQDVFDSLTGREVLVAQGSRLIGRHEGGSRHGEARAFIAWDRLILPDGTSHALSGEPGVDAAGAVGVEGRVDRRLGQLSLATLFAGAITTLGQLARDKDGHDGGLLGDVGDAAAIEAARVGGRLVDRELQVAPSVRLGAGTPVRVLLTRDLVLEPARR